VIHKQTLFITTKSRNSKMNIFSNVCSQFFWYLKIFICDTRLNHFVDICVSLYYRVTPKRRPILTKLKMDPLFWGTPGSIHGNYTCSYLEAILLILTYTLGEIMGKCWEKICILPQSFRKNLYFSQNEYFFVKTRKLFSHFDKKCSFWVKYRFCLKMSPWFFTVYFDSCPMRIA